MGQWVYGSTPRDIPERRKTGAAAPATPSAMKGFGGVRRGGARSVNVPGPHPVPRRRPGRWSSECRAQSHAQPRPRRTAPSDTHGRGTRPKRRRHTQALCMGGGSAGLAGTHLVIGLMEGQRPPRVQHQDRARRLPPHLLRDLQALPVGLQVPAHHVAAAREGSGSGLCPGTEASSGKGDSSREF